MKKKKKIIKCVIIFTIILSLIGCSSESSTSNLIEKQISETNDDRGHLNIENGTIENASTEIKEEYVASPNGTIHVLKEEYLVTDDKSNPDVVILFREYDVLKSDGSSYYVSSVAIPDKGIETTAQAKIWMEANDSEWLKLSPLTVVSEKVLEQWRSENYKTKYEYWDGSPEGLTLNMIKGNS